MQSLRGGPGTVFAIAGSAVMISAILTLAETTVGLYRGQCDPPSACLFLPYFAITGPEVVAISVLAGLPLLTVVARSLFMRVAGVGGAIGAVVLAWASIFVWGARFTYGGQLIFLNGDGAQPFLLVWLLGLLMAGAAITIVGCSGRPRSQKFGGHRSAPGRPLIGN